MDFIEVSAKTYDEAVTEALVKLGLTSDQVKIEVLDKGSSGFLGIGAKPVKIKVTKNLTVDGYLNKFLSDIFEAMKMEVTVHMQIDERSEERRVGKECTG